MAKKEKVAVETPEVEIVEPDTKNTESIEKSEKKANKADKKTAKKSNKDKKGGIGKKVKESVSEIKKVTLRACVICPISIYPIV